jgi:hypothetical protein
MIITMTDNNENDKYGLYYSNDVIVDVIPS